MEKYEVIESRRYKHLPTGRTASLYGACPWGMNKADKDNWIVESVGWTVRNNRLGTVGISRAPWQTKEEAQAFVDSHI